MNRVSGVFYKLKTLHGLKLFFFLIISYGNCMEQVREQNQTYQKENNQGALELDVMTNFLLDTSILVRGCACSK